MKRNLDKVMFAGLHFQSGASMVCLINHDGASCAKGTKVVQNLTWWLSAWEDCTLTCLLACTVFGLPSHSLCRPLADMKRQ